MLLIDWDSSREITELTGKQHGNVMGDIRNMVEDLELPELTFQSGYKDQNYQERASFNLPRDLTDLQSTNHAPRRYAVGCQTENNVQQ